MKKTQAGIFRMLNRQKCILFLIEQAARPVSRLELVKWAFLLRQETPSGGGRSFYDFLPYQYGPFSFTLFREAERLVRDGYLRDVKVAAGDGWDRVPGVCGETMGLSQDVRSDAAGIVDRFVRESPRDLIDYIYERFPWYTANSRIRQLAKRDTAEAAVYTIGYQGWSVDQLLDALMRAGIWCVIDVRRNPIARRYGFHKSSLSRLCGKVGIDYVHVPEVGIPSELRRELDGLRDHARLFHKYEQELLPRETDAVAAIARLVTEVPAALMCMEADPHLCHRSRVADAVSGLTHLAVRHLRGNTCEPVLS